MTRKLLRLVRRHVAVLLAAGIAAALAHVPASAQGVPKIQAVFTNLSSTSDRIVSYRHQEHLWQTGDGALHLVLNRGTLAPGAGLSLWSSHDGGSNWQFQVAFADTDDESVSDGQLVGDELSLVIQTGPDNLQYERLAYDGVNRSWTSVGSEMAYASAQFMAINPGIGQDANGNTWVVFVARDRATNDVNIRLLVRPAGASWVDTGLVFGPTDHRSIERSARLVAVNGAMGLLFTVREMTYWAERPNGADLGAPWQQTTVFAGTPQFRTTDPYASHFGAVVDAAGRLHMTNIDDNNVQYFRRDPAGGAWSGPVLLSSKKSAYSQIGLVNGRPWIAWSAQRGFGNSVASADGGTTWATTATLVLPADAPGVSYGQARVEMPTQSGGPAVVLQQYSDNGVFRLMLFRVPAP